jgi:hypothetical protein
MAVVALGAASLTVTACGPAASTTILNTEALERVIEHSTVSQRGIHTRVSCPSGVHQEKGLVFSCTAVAARGDTRFVVTQLDAAGRVHYSAR